MYIIEKYLKKASDLVKQMTLEEKASFCSGKDFWNTKSLEKLGIPSMMLTDGPHGLRKQAQKADHLGINESVPATCFPTAATTACSFDDALLFEMGQTLGDECLENEVGVVLGPGVNIKRNPLCGRNFEYFSEDPFLSGGLGTNFVKGVQSKNVGVSVKHYLANSQEKARMVSNSIVDERTLREIYMSAFEKVVKEAEPATVMCSYNKINGTYASENKFYMNDVLRGEWGFKGLVVTDWGAICDRVKGIVAGIDLEMPSVDGKKDAEIVAAVKNGEIDESVVDTACANVVALIIATAENEKVVFDKEKHNEIARKVARESAVLLENDGILPLKKEEKIAILGQFAKKPRYQGAGSSKINPIKITSLCDELTAQNIVYSYADGYSEDDEVKQEYIDEAVKVAQDAQTVVCVIGLPDSYESEGFDRNHMQMPQSHNTLIEEVLKVNKNVVVVTLLGSPVQMPWRKDVKAVLNMYLGGQNVGGATYDLLYGLYSPCGKLAETFPIIYADTPNHDCFANEGKFVPYKESIYVGYRYYEKFGIETAYPFGYGLSYSSFAYSNINVDEKTVSFDITNTGKVKAKEIAQLYIAAPKSQIYKAKKELKGYAKVELEPNQTKNVTIILDDRSFAFWNVNINDWQIENGTYEVLVCSNSEKVELTTAITLSGYKESAVPNYSETAKVYYAMEKWNVPTEVFETVLGRKVPSNEIERPFTSASTLGDMQCTKIGREMKEKLLFMVSQAMQAEDLKAMFTAMLEDMPIRNLTMMSGGKFDEEAINQILYVANNE